jgi:hypothetical protein
MYARTLASFLLLAGTSACGPGTKVGDGSGSHGSGGGSADEASSGPGGTSVTTQADSTATGGGAALPEGCSCREPDEDAFSCAEEANSDCAGEALCPDIYGVCSRPNPDLYMCASEYVYDEAELACAITALRDRTPGKLALDAENDICGLEGCGSDRTEITIFADGGAVVRHCGSNPLSVESSTTTLDALAEPAYFDECLGLGTTTARYQCMVDGLTQGPEVCG